MHSTRGAFCAGKHIFASLTVVHMPFCELLKELRAVIWIRIITRLAILRGTDRVSASPCRAVRAFPALARQWRVGRASPTHLPDSRSEAPRIRCDFVSQALRKRELPDTATNPLGDLRHPGAQPPAESRNPPKPTSKSPGGSASAGIGRHTNSGSRHRRRRRHDQLRRERAALSGLVPARHLAGRFATEFRPSHNEQLRC
jgi:hypothetical protein